MIASAKEIDALDITLFNSCINFTNVHLCNYCTKIFVIIVNTCVCRRSVDNKALILSYPIQRILSTVAVDKSSQHKLILLYTLKQGRQGLAGPTGTPGVQGGQVRFLVQSA